MSNASFKVIVTFERREDGGLRVWSEDLPGLVLSHRDIEAILDDVKTAIETIVSDRFGAPVEVRPLLGLREALEDNGVIDPSFPLSGQREYVAYHVH